MKTDYGAADFPRRYIRTRRLDTASTAMWASILARYVGRDEVDRVLDAGAGVGRFFPVFRTAWAPMHIVALDNSLEMLQVAAEQGDVASIAGNVDRLPLGNDSGFDVVFCSMILHYSEDPRACVTRLRSTLRPDGWLFVRTGTRETLSSYDFLDCFPTALAAERRAMPSIDNVLPWFQVDGLALVAVEEVSSPSHSTRSQALADVWRRGFPSLQLVGEREFVRGVLRYCARLVVTLIRGSARPAERSVILVSRRTA